MNSLDPFAPPVDPTAAPAPAADATAAPTNPDAWAGAPGPADPPTSTVRMTFKAGSGYDAPWIVIDAPDVAGANAILNDSQSLKDLFDRSARAGAYYAGLGPSSTQRGGAGGGGQQAAGPQTAPGGETRYCSHGEMRFMSGISKKTGRPYSMFVCPHPDRQQQCRPQNPGDGGNGGGQQQQSSGWGQQPQQSAQPPF